MVAADAQADPEEVVLLSNLDGQSNIVLVCEHASNQVPREYAGLGLSPAVLESHIAWDPGAMEVAGRMSALLDARLVSGAVSRLVYDCNRPPHSPAAMPARSEIHAIPGNEALDDPEREKRISRYYRPFEHALARTLRRVGAEAVLVTIHSFTPVYLDQKREVELGILHDEDSRLADAIMRRAPAHTDMIVRRNEPYSAKDGVTHTLKQHGVAHGRLNVMLEIRNDLIARRRQCDAMAQTLAALLLDALALLDPPDRQARTGT